MLWFACRVKVLVGSDTSLFLYNILLVWRCSDIVGEVLHADYIGDTVTFVTRTTPLFCLL